MIFVYALGIWFGIVAIAVLNGVFRNAVIAPRLGDYLGHVVSSVILSCIILIVTCIFISNLTIACTTADLLLIGLLWLGLTVSFEFLFGHYVAGHSWETCSQVLPSPRKNRWQAWE